jgi:hypothetical protein
MTTTTLTRTSCTKARRHEAELREQEIERLLAHAADREAEGCDFEARRLRRIAMGMRGITAIVVCNG